MSRVQTVLEVLVERDYRVGLFISAGDFTGDLPELPTLLVEPLRSNGAAAHYASAHRGVVELEFEMHAVKL